MILEAVTSTIREYSGSRRCRESMHASLAQLGEAMDVSRVCIFKNQTGENGEPVTCLWYEWVALGIDALTDKPEMFNRPLRSIGMERSATLLSDGHVIRANVRDLSATEQNVFLPRGVKSVLVIPIFVGERWWGFAEFDECRTERKWSDMITDVLRITADIIGLTIERKNILDALKQSEERFALAEKAVNIGIWDYDLVTGHIEWSDQIEPMFGFGRGQLGKTYGAFIERVHPDDRQHFADSINSAAEKTKNHDFEHRIVCPDGTVRWVAETTEVFRDESGNAVRILGIVQDITRWKEVERQLDHFVEQHSMRLREVDHRVENILMSIIGMLHMKEDRARMDGAEPLGALIGHIRGLATTYKLFAASGWQPLVLSRLCEQVIEAAIKSVPLFKTVHFNVTPSPVKITNSQANHLTLVFNELTTNSVKHALGDRDNVQIDVTIFETGNQITVRFRDNGPGYPQEMLEGDYSRAGVGFELICGIIAHSLAGKIQIKNDNGAVTIIQFRKQINDDDDKERVYGNPEKNSSIGRGR